MSLQPGGDPAVRCSAWLGVVFEPVYFVRRERAFRVNLNDFLNRVFHFLTLGLLYNIVNVRIRCLLNDKHKPGHRVGKKNSVNDSKLNTAQNNSISNDGGSFPIEVLKTNAVI
jgi:hypothetical protein